MSRIKFKKLHALHDYVIVTDMNFKEKITNGGIVLLGDDKKLEGVKPRWGRVYAVGPQQTTIKVGQFVCIAHGRWTRGLEIEDDQGQKTLRRVDNNDILMVSDEPVNDDTIGNSI